MADHPNLAELVESWDIALEAERKSPHTRRAYLRGVRAFLAWCDETGTAAVLERRAVNRWVASMLSGDMEPSSAAKRLQGVRLYAAWLVEEEELDANPLVGMKQPKIDTKVVEPLSEDQIKAMLKACSTGDKFRDRRDEAILRFMVETGCRAGEVVALELDDVDLRGGEAIVRRGKGGKGRRVPFGSQCARALDRYRRVRSTHRVADDTSMLWLGEQGALTYAGLYRALTRRATMAGIRDFHPHKLRNTAAHRWLAAGGSTDGLMAVAGWSRPEMLTRYTRARAEDRAAAEARSLNLGDL